MASPNREQLLNMGIQSAKQGNAQGARVMLRQVLEQDPKNERAMLWMAKTAKSPTERKQWLRRVLEVNPDNGVAKKALDQMEHRAAASENRRLFYFGSIAVAAFMVLTLIGAAAWAFADLT
ncbi:MAG: tetratricopeptide repeat protein [Chloroflexota bacterium]